MTPYYVTEDYVTPFPDPTELDPLCLESRDEISNPEPFPGYDCRCRPWY